MTYKDKLDFIKNEDRGIKRIGRIEYVANLKKQGMNDRQIQAQMILDNVSKPNMIFKDLQDYKKVEDKIGWMQVSDLHKEYSSTTLGSKSDWIRFDPFRKAIEDVRSEKFSQNSWRRVQNTWERKFNDTFMNNSHTNNEEDWLLKTNEGRSFITQVNRWISKHRDWVFDIQENTMRERRKSEMNHIKNIMKAGEAVQKQRRKEASKRIFRKAVSEKPISPTAGVEQTFSNKKKKTFTF